MPLRALYIDFNSYFASVEQQLRPELRGRPVAVVPVLAETTCCIAASYEAKQLGVRTGTLVREARQLCPALQLVEARPAVYVEFHHRLVEAVESCAHVEKVLSIDEMYCELHGAERQRERAVALAGAIKSAVASRVGAQLRCSIGIAPNVFLAKTATELQKPDGLAVIEEQDLPECLYGLKLCELCGIGEKMEKRLRALGITTVEALCRADKATLRHAWGGIGGERIYERLRGKWLPEPPTVRSSIGHSHVLPPALRSRRAARSVLHRLLQKAAMRLRRYGLVAGALEVQVKWLNGARWERRVRFDLTQDTLQLLEALGRAWSGYPEQPPSVPLAVGITLHELEEEIHQPRSLFDDVEARNRLNATMDRLNLRYGSNTVYFGGAHLALKAAPMRIAFNHIPDPAVEGD
ncbi:MAG TPA: DNA polymerase [Candidatus Xenobia bacterium]|nr:DNA polymerase [Candidatus Xenobia bacterium]